MKKQYIEPDLIVEDFEVSEMIAGNCKVEANILVVMEMSNYGCWNGDFGPNETYDQTKIDAYRNISELFHGAVDLDGDGVAAGLDLDDKCFTPAYHTHPDAGGHCTKKPLSETPPTTFGHGWSCNGDSSLIQVS